MNGWVDVDILGFFSMLEVEKVLYHFHFTQDSLRKGVFGSAERPKSTIFFALQE